ncbi:group II intron maturase-specific domain-containing protein [Thermodesulfobacteriota bacterium]
MLKGWSAYLKIQEFLNLFRDLDGWIRNRLRSKQLKKWKKPKRFQNMMIKSYFKPYIAH